MIGNVDAATPNANANPNYDNDEAGPSGVASLPNRALMSTEQHLTTPLRPILKDKARAVSKLNFLRHCATRDLIPKGAQINVPLKIVDPPVSLKEKWEGTLKECSNHLLRILVDFHRSQISNFEELADETINKSCHTVIPEYITSIPDIGDKIEVAIQELIDTTGRTTKKMKSLKRTSKENDTQSPPAKKRKNKDNEKHQHHQQQKNAKSPSKKEGHLKKKSLKLIKTKKTKPQNPYTIFTTLT